MNYVSAGLGVILIFVMWWLWCTFEDIRIRGPNPDPKGDV
jgi:hypothetical protein